MLKIGKGRVILNIASDMSVSSTCRRLYRKEDFAADMQPVKPTTNSVLKEWLIDLKHHLSTLLFRQELALQCPVSNRWRFNFKGEAFAQSLSAINTPKRMSLKLSCTALQFPCSDAYRYMNRQNIVMGWGRSVW
jgi:hypothetical protein